MPAFRALRDALAAVPGTDYRFSVIPALRGDEAVEAVLNAVLAEAEKEAASMEADLAKDLGKRAMENRIGRCEAVESKVAQYERLLDKSMGGMRERLDALRVQLTVAMLKPTAEEEKTG
jgi:hypothetical protein